MNEGHRGRLAAALTRAALVPVALAGTVLLAAGCGGGGPAAPANTSSPRFQAALQKCNGG